jgi:putative SOS response-associated peptidase YedK
MVCCNWRNAQKCIVPVQAFYEPDWQSGKVIATRFELASGEPMGIAGLWSRWTDGDRVIYSFTMLTVNADAHALMKHYHQQFDFYRLQTSWFLQEH